MDFEDVIGKPVKLKMKTGQVLTGCVQRSADRSQVPFLTSEKQQKLQERFGKRELITVPIHDVNDFIDVFECSEIESFEIIETDLSVIHLVTEGLKHINIEGFQIEIQVTEKPGRLRVRYKLPENEKCFDLGEFEIKGGAIQLPITMAFISYAKEDQKKVESISRDLNDYGILTWFDKGMLLPGDDWLHLIEQAIEQADYFLLFLSNKTMDRVGYKNREFKLALYQQSLRPVSKRFIIPILLDDCNPYHEIANLNWLKITDDGWFTKLLKAIAPFHIKQKLHT